MPFAKKAPGRQDARGNAIQIRVFTGAAEQRSQKSEDSREFSQEQLSSGARSLKIPESFHRSS
jgi:hypothetical protein